MKIPGPDHPIAIAAAGPGQRWRARFHGHVIADTADALILREAAYPPVVYFPAADVTTAVLSRTAHSTHCPYKGDASYYTVAMDGHIAENAIWTYETPYPAMAEIAGRLAFYPDKVEVYAVNDAAVNPHHHDTDVNDVVRHTDAGDGRAQAGHWTPNVDGPSPEGGVR